MAVGKYLPEANPGPAEDVAVTIKNLLEGLGGGSQLSHDQLDDVSVDDHHAQSHNIASHSDTTATGTELDALTDNSMADTLHRHSELSASDGTPDAVVSVDSDGILYADAAPVGIDILYSGVIGAHLTVGNNIIIGGTVDGVDIAARDHAESHSVASHNDTTATGANLNTLVGGGQTALHSHAGGGASFATGSYTGDEGAPRQITTGFACKLVVICKVGTLGIWYWLVMNASGADSLQVGDTDQVDDQATPYLHATDGFVVTGTDPGANQGSVNYKYVAFGE